jgi:hypothetical protein
MKEHARLGFAGVAAVLAASSVAGAAHTTGDTYRAPATLACLVKSKVVAQAGSSFIKPPYPRGMTGPLLVSFVFDPNAAEAEIAFLQTDRGAVAFTGRLRKALPHFPANRFEVKHNAVVLWSTKPGTPFQRGKIDYCLKLSAG